MLSKILPAEIYTIIADKLNYNKIYELRMRRDSPIMIDYGGKLMYLSNFGVSTNEKEAILSDEELVNTVVFKASEYSVYAVNSQIQQGFISTFGGIRIGVCGEVVEENGIIKTIKNISSINVRIPHQIENCAVPALNYIVLNGEILNTLIISPPGGGKTTLLRDIASQLSRLNIGINVLMVDERYELAGSQNGKNTLEVGKFTDVLSGGNKQFALIDGVRTMRPDVIITDELASLKDAEAVKNVANAGVSIFASIHAENIKDLKKKEWFKSLIEEKVFKRYVVLSRANGAGTYESIFDENFNIIMCR